MSKIEIIMKLMVEVKLWCLLSHNYVMLVLNSDKTKMMCFSKSRKTDDACQIVTLDEKVIERVSVYKYLGFLLEESLSFKQHIEWCLTKKLRVKLGFYYRNERLFLFQCEKNTYTSNISVNAGLRWYFIHACKSIFVENAGFSISCIIKICN